MAKIVTEVAKVKDFWWQIICCGALAFIGADILGCLFNGGRVRTTNSSGEKVWSLRTFTRKHTVGNFIRALIIGALAGLAHCVPRATENPVWGWVFFCTMMLLLAWATIWTIINIKRWTHWLWFVVLATAIIWAMQAAVGVASLSWDSRALSWVFFVIPWMVFALAIGFIGFVLVFGFFRAGRGAGWRVIAILLAVLTVASCVVIAVNGESIARLPKISGSSSGASGMSADEAEAIQAEKDDAIAALTIPLADDMSLAKYDYSKELRKSSLSPCDQSRTQKTGMSDALTFGIESSTTSEMLIELEEEIFRNPVVGITYANALKDKEVCGEPLTKLNSWLLEISKKKWYDYGYIDGDKYYVTNEYRRYAASLCDLFKVLVPQGVQELQTVENWHRNSAVKNSERAGEKSPYQYKRKSLILAYVTKDRIGDKNLKGLFVIGVNLDDKRPEFYDDEPELVKESPPKKDNPNPEPTTAPGSGPSPTEGPKPEPEPSPTEPQRYNKDKSQSDNSGTNDDQGHGPDTNNGEGAQYSSDDQPGNSDHQGSVDNYEDKIHKNENDGQRTGPDGDQPSDDGGADHIDNNGGAANEPSASRPEQPAVAGDPNGQKWDGPDL